MIKRTLYISNPAYLSKKDEQLVVKKPDENEENKKNITVPIEDIGLIILDHGQITLTHGLISGLLDNNCAVVTCDRKHMPSGLFLPLESNYIQSEKFRDQLDSSEPLRKQLWQQTITAKISNQAGLLKRLNVPITNMMHWAKKVRSGDPDNYEGRAAAYYWKNIFPQFPGFIRDRYGEPPNNVLNYGYAILRSITARSLVGSGLLPTLGIHHHNKYNAYCLADDIMEPYRPFVDIIVYRIINLGLDFIDMDKSVKEELFQIPTADVVIDEKRSPLMVAMQRTTASLAKCFEGELRKVLYPAL